MAVALLAMMVASACAKSVATRTRPTTSSIDGLPALTLELSATAPELRALYTAVAELDDVPALPDENKIEFIDTTLTEWIARRAEVLRAGHVARRRMRDRPTEERLVATVLHLHVYRDTARQLNALGWSLSPEAQESLALHAAFLSARAERVLRSCVQLGRGVAVHMIAWRNYCERSE